MICVPMYFTHISHMASDQLAQMAQSYDENTRLDFDQVKEMTGNDEFYPRQLFSSNSHPMTNEQRDEAVWRRVLKNEPTPFGSTFMDNFNYSKAVNGLGATDDENKEKIDNCDSKECEKVHHIVQPGLSRPPMPKTMEPQPMVIVLKKEYDTVAFEQLIIKFENALASEPPPSSVKVATNSWAGDCRPYATIPAAKKLFQNAINAGLMGCLLEHHYIEAAREMYAVAYGKGRRKGEHVQLRGIDPVEMMQVGMKSITTYRKLMEGHTPE
jgi:hypothetical protein